MTYRQPLVALSLAALGSLGSAHAADVGQHPAVYAPRQLPGIEASTFIVGHPAHGGPGRVHANAEHPAVKGHGAARRIDTDRFIVQPPATTRWIATPAQPVTPTLAQVRSPALR